MSSSETTKQMRKLQHNQKQRSIGMFFTLLFGGALGGGLLALIHYGPVREPILVKYTSHPVEQVTVLLFGIGVAALLFKLLGFGREWAAFHARMLPDWDGNAVPADEADELRVRTLQSSPFLRNTYLGRRVMAVLDFIDNRRSADHLDDHLRGLADNDDIALENSYGLVRLITWAIPILGFLGTVLGITGAIAGVSPEVLEQSLNQVTRGLATAFDTTATALALTMALMFLSFITERMELGLLERVNQTVDDQLAHRFARIGSKNGEFVDALQQNTDVLLQATEAIVRKQIQLWQEALSAAQRQWSETGKQHQESLTTGLEEALQRTAEGHLKRLAIQEKKSMQSASAAIKKLEKLSNALSESSSTQQQTLVQLIDRVNAQTNALEQLTGTGANLVQLQEAMQHNLDVLAGTAAFDQTLSSLTAAIHILTARAGSVSTPGGDPPKKFGEAA